MTGVLLLTESDAVPLTTVGDAVSVGDTVSVCTMVDVWSNRVKKLHIIIILIIHLLIVLTNKYGDWWCHSHAGSELLA